MPPCLRAEKSLSKAHPSQLARESAFAQALKLLLHRGILPEQLIHFLYRGAGAARNALAPATVDGLVVVALIRGHRIDDRLYAIQLLVVYFGRHALNTSKWTDAGKHLHNTL